MSLLRLHRAVAAAALLLLLALCALGPASCARVTLALPLEQTSGCNGCRKVIGDGVVSAAAAASAARAPAAACLL